jgi:hypothetical protein
MSLVEPVDMQIGISSTASHHVLFSKKHTYVRQRSQVYAGAPEWLRMVLHSRLMFWYCIWQGSDAADVAHSAKWQCVRVEEPA